MKKRNLIAVLMMTAALAAGCGAKAETTTAAPTQAETTKAETTQAETTQSETTQSESQKTEEKTESVTGKIEEIKDFIYDLVKPYPDLKERIFGAMQRYPLEAWEPHGRYKRPKEPDDLEF